MERAARRGDGYVAEWVLDAGDFSALAAEWHKLYRSSPRATPFQAHGWLDSWWRAYGRPGRLRVALVRDQAGRLLAAAPLHLRRRAAVRVLAPLGGAISDFTDLLVAEDLLEPDQVTAVLSALAGCLQGLRGWDVLDLPEVRRGAAVEPLFDAWQGPRWSLASSTCMELHACGFPDLLKRLSTKRAGELRRRLRRADELGLVLTDVPAEEVGDGVADLIRLHALQWEGRGINPEHLRPRFSRHIAGALATMIRDGQAALTRFRLEDDVVAVTLDLVGHDMVCGYLLGVMPSLYEKMDFTTYVLRHELQRMAESGFSIFNMLRGRESYKDRWRPVVVRNRRLVMGRPGIPQSHLFALGVRTRARAVAVVRDRAPWVQPLRQRLGALRSAAGAGR